MKQDTEGERHRSEWNQKHKVLFKMLSAGKIYESGMTAEQMKVSVKDKLKKFGFPGFVAGLFTEISTSRAVESLNLQ